MDFRYSSEDLALQEEVRRFDKENWDPGPFNAHTMNVWSYDFDSAEARERDKEFIKKIIARGWWIMHWPKEFGGKDAPISTQVAYREQMAYLGAPAALGGGLSMPPIVIHGNDYQKRFFL
ncbi:MAG: acyl-CoA dehydrogenase family protein, partial [Chloroflexi bacterium]|nr:acyl-CoA dehydrogenase family protein [Chloroflexota bacterium]